ncbi:MAG: hypothetical protein M9942_12800 [Microthrixaceae bacterium]|nr:hypothetical protein [Microthrixaceae bacterium]MCO5319304.1 hypothetical protein [Microthrixaceae bacterium]
MAKRQVTEAQKKAMARGRANSRVVREYLEVLDRNKPKRGRRRTPASIRKRLAVIDSEFDGASQLAKLEMTQERMDLNAELEAMETSDDLDAVQKSFVGIAAEYSESKGISWAAWREMGVPAAVLREAGVPRS